MKNTTQYSEREVEEAAFAVEIDTEARVNSTTARGAILEAAGDGPNSPAYARELQGRYNAGRLILDGDTSIILVSSGRFGAPAGVGQVEHDKLGQRHDLVSPAVLTTAGYIATSRACRWIALARRKS